MSEPKLFLDGRVTLYGGNCIEVLAELPENSVDAVCCDPPYHLTSIVKRFGGEKAAEAKVGAAGAFKRASAGFMGKQWDGGDIAFRPETWAAVLRILKPGGHLVAFGGTRTYHRLAVAIEDAGFEIRDQLAWTYGSGFPKSHDVSKDIDKRGGKQVSWFGPWLKHWRTENNVKQSEVSALFPSKSGGKTGCVANWELGLNLPTNEQFNLICSTFGLPFQSLEEAEREVTSTGYRVRRDSTVQIAGNSDGNYDITAPATREAAAWEGWGTALKPAWEPICLARKPLSGTVAANVLEHGTGAINIDGCRIHADDDAKTKDGRWPANLIHDGSEEVLAAFPDAGGQQRDQDPNSPSDKTAGIYGKMKRIGEASANSRYTDKGATNFAALPGQRRGDSGSAARFFYTAKADAEDRLGSKHPTVKPLDLMQYLCRLITPPGGTILDPFSGTGTIGEAAFREGFKAILIEREPEYQADIARRMELAENPTKRAAVAKSKNALQGAEGTPLFGGSAEETGGGVSSTTGSQGTDDRSSRAQMMKSDAA